MDAQEEEEEEEEEGKKAFMVALKKICQTTLFIWSLHVFLWACPGVEEHGLKYQHVRVTVHTFVLLVRKGAKEAQVIIFNH